MGFGRQVDRENTPKIDQTYDQKNQIKKEATWMAKKLQLDVPKTRLHRRSLDGGRMTPPISDFHGHGEGIRGGEF